MKFRILLFITVSLAFIISSCSDMMDVHSEYIQDGETRYSVKVDSTIIYPGNERVRIKGFMKRANKVKNIIVTSKGIDNKESQRSFPFDYNQAKDTFRVEFDIPEGKYLFELTTETAEGFLSVPVTYPGSIYGASYKSILDNKKIEDIRPHISGGVVMTFKGNFDNLVSVKVQYQTKAGENKSIVIPASQTKLVISDINLTKPLNYSSGYLPSEMALDTVYTEVSTKSLEALIGMVYEFQKDEWEVLEYSSQQVGLAPNVFDGNINTYWQSAWNNPFKAPLPHYVIIDMKYEVTATEIDLYRRTDVNHCKTVVVEGSLDGTSWVEIGTFEYDADISHKNVIKQLQSIHLRYMKINITDSHVPPYGGIGEVILKGINN